MKNLLLIGGGHAHVHVIDAHAKEPFADTTITLVSPYPRQIYSGMLPGWIVGDYTLDQCAIPIDRLAGRAGIRFVETACTGLDLDRRQALCANGEIIDFDFASIDTGPTIANDITTTPANHVIPIRPIEGFVAAWPALLERARRQTTGFDLCIVGDGAAGTELAFTIGQRFIREGLRHARVILIGGHDEPLPGQPASLRRAAKRLLARRGIRFLPNHRASAFAPEQIIFADGDSLACQASLIVTGAAAPAWPAVSGLACDEKGFIQVTQTLQSESHRFVLAAGDVASYTESRPKSGVFAVRAGPILANNLRALCANRDLTAWAPQTKALYLISTGTQHALASWGGLSSGCCEKLLGGMLWRWKDRIDRAFMRRFS